MDNYISKGNDKLSLKTLSIIPCFSFDIHNESFDTDNELGLASMTLR